MYLTPESIQELCKEPRPKVLRRTPTELSRRPTVFVHGPVVPGIVFPDRREDFAFNALFDEASAIVNTFEQNEALKRRYIRAIYNPYNDNLRNFTASPLQLLKRILNQEQFETAITSCLTYDELLHRRPIEFGRQPILQGTLCTWMYREMTFPYEDYYTEVNDFSPHDLLAYMSFKPDDAKDHARIELLMHGWKQGESEQIQDMSFVIAPDRPVTVSTVRRL